MPNIAGVKRGRCVVITLAAMAVSIGGATPARAAFQECASSIPPVVVDAVACVRYNAPFVGAESAFSYYVPPVCDPAAQPKPRCPVLYLLHGFGGDYRSMLGTAGGAPSAWIRSLTQGPPVDPRAVADPWRYADPATWIPRAPLDIVLVAPHGRTLSGGSGPLPNLDSYWVDWNPRYAANGDQQRYTGPPPKFETELLFSLMPFAEARLGTHSGREGRGIVGTSLGGYGAYMLALRHPDLFATAGSVSGALNFLLAPGLDPVDGPGADTTPPVFAGYTPLPGAAPTVPLEQVPEQARGYAVSFYALGDPVADHAYYRGHMPRDLALNARARNGAAQSLHLRAIVNDAVPRRPEDFASPPGYIGAQAFESLVLAMNVETDAAFGALSVEREFQIHPGVHSGAYWDPFLRAQLESHYARLRHRDGTGSPPPDPVSFSYRSIDRSIDVWGWSFGTDTPGTGFLTIRSASCTEVVLQGTGSVLARVRPPCGTGVDGRPWFVADLGEPYPTDEPAGASSISAYGRTVRVPLTPLT